MGVYKYSLNTVVVYVYKAEQLPGDVPANVQSVISGFHRGANEIFALLRCYAA
jgi:hypothetical protein